MKNLNPLYESSDDPLINPEAPRIARSVMLGPFGVVAYDVLDKYDLTPEKAVKKGAVVVGRGIRNGTRAVGRGIRNGFRTITFRRKQQPYMEPTPENDFD